jgi:CheY-like chemotaxis protein
MDIAHLHFLVAQADPSERRALVALLGQLGAGQVTDVADGAAALQALDAGATPRVNVALIDLDLPGMDGLTLLRRLGEIQCAARLVVTGAQPAGLLFSVETLAEAFGIELLGAIARPVTAVTLKPVLENYTPLPRLAQTPAEPRFTFQQVGIGLQKRQFEPYFQPKIELATGQVKGLEVFAR